MPMCTHGKLGRVLIWCVVGRVLIWCVVGRVLTWCVVGRVLTWCVVSRDMLFVLCCGSHTVLLHYATLYCTMSHRTALCHTILHYVTPYCTVPHRTAIYHTTAYLPVPCRLTRAVLHPCLPRRYAVAAVAAVVLVGAGVVMGRRALAALQSRNQVPIHSMSLYANQPLPGEAGAKLGAGRGKQGGADPVAWDNAGRGGGGLHAWDNAGRRVDGASKAGLTRWRGTMLVGRGGGRGKQGGADPVAWDNAVGGELGV